MGRQKAECLALPLSRNAAFIEECDGSSQERFCGLEVILKISVQIIDRRE
jgi:hypothetical protein